MAKYTDKTKGILFIVLAALGFALMSLFVKFVDNDIPTTQKVLFRNGISVIVSFFMVVYHKESFYGKKENTPLLLLRSTFGTIGMLLFFYSISTVDSLGDVNMLNKLSTFFLIIFSAIFLGEKVKKYQITMIVVAFIGSLFIIKPSFEVDLFPYMASVLAAVAAGAAYTVLRVLGTKEKYYTVVLFFSTFSVVSITSLMLLIDKPFFNFAPMNFTEILYLTLAGLFATVGQFGTTLAYKYAPAKEISIFNYTNVVFASILSIIVFSDVPDVYSIVGYFIIFGAAYYMFKRKK